MSYRINRSPLCLYLTFVAVSLLAARPAWAGGKMSVLEGVVRAAMEEGQAGARATTRLADEARLLRGGEELFEQAAKQHDLLLRGAGRTGLDEPAIARRLTGLSRNDSAMAQTLAQMSAAERRFVAEAAETAGSLSRRFPNEAAQMVQKLGPEGLTYTRAYGPQVAEVVLREGPETLGVIRKGGRGAWTFFTESVLPHKKKLVAAGVFAAFLANPDEFVDIAGRATDYAVREFARAGVELASALPQSVAGGINAGVDRVLTNWGLNYAPLRYGMVTLLLFLAAGAALRLFGWPIRTIFWPVTIAVRRLRGIAR